MGEINRIQYAMIDAFTNESFKGNPAAVCLLPPGADDATWMQFIAAEFNVSQTAFLIESLSKTEYDYELRWFTPSVEVKLCGHATLASAYYLFAEGRVKSDIIRFKTKSGVLTARKIKSAKFTSSSQIELEFPIMNIISKDSSAYSTDTPTFCGAKVVSMSNTERGDLLVELSSEDDVKNLQPDFEEIAGAANFGVIVTARGKSSKFDFVSRYFAPNVGINEDPVCGSAHCALGPYWARKLGKDSLFAYQASKRGGKLGLEVKWDTNCVLLQGEAVMTMCGFIQNVE